MADRPSRMFPVPLSRVSFGVRYEPQYRVMDYIGEITDEILHADGTPFGTDVFPHTQTEVQERMLVAPGRVLRLNQQDAILMWDVETRSLDEISKLAKNYNDYALAPLKKAASLSNVFRYGMLLNLTQQTGLKNPPLRHFLAKDFPASSLTSLTMRFTRRLPSTEAMWRKDVEDFRTIIYIVEETEKGEVKLTLDYQEYFKPLLDASDLNKHPYTSFVEHGLNYLDQEGSKWLKSFTETGAAVA